MAKTPPVVLTSAKDVKTTYSLDTSLLAGRTTNTVQNTGVNYIVGDLLYIVGGTYTLQASMVITAVDGNGKPLGLRVNQPGSYTVTPNAPVSTTTNSANGTGVITLTPIWLTAPTKLPVFIDNNYLSLGGKNDGVTNNTPLLRAAITACIAVGIYNLYVPPAGDYNFILDGTPIDLPAGFTLHGLPGLGKTKFKIDPSSWTGVAAGVTRTLLRYNSGCTIAGIEFDGQKSLTNSGNFTGYGLCFINRANNYASDCLFEDLTFRNQLSGSASLECFCWASGYYSQRIKLVKCKAFDCNGTAYSFNGTMSYGGVGSVYEVNNPGTMVNDCDVIDCSAYRCRWQGLTLFGARNIRVLNFTGDSCGSIDIFGGQAINLEWCDNILIDNPSCTNCVGPGIGGFGWLNDIQINLVGTKRIYNNNNIDYNDLGEIAFKRGAWYTVGFPSYPNGTGQWRTSTGAATGGYYRQNIIGVLQSITIRGPAGSVVPKTTGNIKNHFVCQADVAAIYPNTKSTQPTRIYIEVGDSHTWRTSYLTTQTYPNSNANMWAPNTAVTANITRRNGGILWTCTQAGTTGAAPGPLGNTGDSVNDGTAVWSATSVLTERIGVGTEWVRNAGIVYNDIRCNAGYIYRATTPNDYGFTSITATTGNGPVGTVTGATETDGTVVWQCIGPLVSSGSKAKPLDLWPTGVRIEGILPLTGSACSPIMEWTATGVTRTNKGNNLSHNVTLTSTTSSSSSGTSAALTDARYLTPGSYVARIRYRGTSDENWFFLNRLIGMYDSSSGAYQNAAHLSGPIDENLGFYESEIPFTVPINCLSRPSISYFGQTIGATITDVSVKIMPLRRGSYNKEEIYLGGRKIIYGNTSSLLDVDMDVGDRVLSSAGYGSDAICSTAGSFGTINPATTLTIASGSATGTLSQADPTIRAGMWLNILGSSGSMSRRVTYVSGTTITFSSSAGSAINAIAPLVFGPVFTSLSTSVSAAPTNTNLGAKAGGGQTGATQTYYGYNHFSNVTTAGDSAILPVALKGREVRILNGAGNSLALFPAVGEKVGTGAAAANASINLGSQSHLILTCFIDGLWSSK